MAATPLKYSSGPDSMTPATWDFPESGTEKGVRDFKVPKRLIGVRPFFRQVAYSHIRNPNGLGNIFTLKKEVVRHAPHSC